MATIKSVLTGLLQVVNQAIHIARRVEVLLFEAATIYGIYRLFRLM